MAKPLNETEALNKALESVRFAVSVPQSHRTFRPLSPKPASAPIGGMAKLMEGLPDTAGDPVMVRLDEIDDSPYQTSPLNEDKVLELVENLQVNPMTTPVVVRRMSDGRMQLIAGRHRKEAYRVLGRTQIECVIRELSDDEAERLVFYDNLFGPKLTDYQKYLGFAARRDSKEYNLSQLSRESGVDRTVITRLMAFDNLPAEVHAALRKHPDAVGASLAPAFSALAQQYPLQAVQAVEKIAAGEMTQGAAMKWLREGGDPKKIVPGFRKTPIMVNNKVYAEVTNKGNSLVVKLKDQAQMDDLEQRLLAWLQETAQPAT